MKKSNFDEMVDHLKKKRPDLGRKYLRECLEALCKKIEEGHEGPKAIGFREDQEGIRPNNPERREDSGSDS